MLGLQFGSELGRMLYHMSCHVLLHLGDACADLTVSLHQPLPGLFGCGVVRLCRVQSP